MIAKELLGMSLETIFKKRGLAPEILEKILRQYSQIRNPNAETTK